MQNQKMPDTSTKTYAWTYILFGKAIQNAKIKTDAPYKLETEVIITKLQHQTKTGSNLIKTEIILKIQHKIINKMIYQKLQSITTRETISKLKTTK